MRRYAFVHARLLIVLCCAALIGLVWALALERIHYERTEALHDTVRQNDNLTVAFEEQTVRALKAVEQALLYLKHEYQRHGRIADPQELFNEGVLDAAYVRSYLFTDARGRALRSDLAPGPIDVSDREYFDWHRANRSAAIFISKPFDGRLTGKPVIPVTQRLEHADGSFRGVVAIGLDPAYFLGMNQAFNLGPRGLMQIAGLDGIVRVRRLGGETSFGQDLRESRLLAAVRQAAAGSFVSRGLADGTSRMQSYRVLRGYALVVTVGVAEEDALARFRGRRRDYYLGAAAASLLVVLFGAVLLSAYERARAAEAERRRLDAAYRATFEQAAVGIAHADAAGRFLKVNRRLCDMLGYGEAELMGLSWGDVVPADERERVSDLLRTLFANPEPRVPEMEGRYRRKDGAERWGIATISLVHGPDGAPDYIATVLRDVTAHKQAEAGLLEKMDELRRFQKLTVDRELRLQEIERADKMAPDAPPVEASAAGPARDAAAPQPAGSEEERQRRALLHMLEDLRREHSAAADARQQWLDTVDAVSSPMMVHDEEFRVVRANRAYAERSGMAFSELIGRPYWECFPRLPGPMPKCGEAMMAGGPKPGLEEEITLASGEVFLSKAFPIRNAADARPHALHIFEDVTERRRAERQLKLFRNLLDHGQDEIAVIDPETLKILDVNERMSRRLGYSRAELLASSIRDCNPVVDPLYEEIDRKLKAGGAAVFESQHRRKDGSTYPVEVTVRAIRLDRLYLLSVARDISERKQAEDALRLAHERLRRLVDSNIVGVLIAAPTGEVFEANDYCLRLTGYTREEVAQGGLNWRAITPAEWLPVSERAMWELEQHGTSDPYEKEYVRRDGTRVPVFLTDAKLPGPGGLFVAFVLDRTQAKLAEEKMRALARFPDENPHAVMRVGADGIVQYGNAASVPIQQYCGAREGERVNDACLELVRDTLASRELRTEEVRQGGRHYALTFAPIAAAGYINVYGVDITERKRAEQALRRLNRALLTLSSGNEALVRASDENALLRELIRVVTTVGGYPIAWVGYALHDAQKLVEVKACTGLDETLMRQSPPSWGDDERGQGVTGRAIRLGEPQIERELASNPSVRPWRPMLAAAGVRAVLGLPLRLHADDAPFGALAICSPDADAFDDAELKLLSDLASDLGYGIANLRARDERRAATAKLRRGLEATVEAIAATLEARDPYTAGHQRRVAGLAAAIAREMGLDAAAVEGIHFGALIHDLGKIQVPAELLAKPTRLSRIELELIRTHPQAGYDIVKGIEFPWPVAAMVHQHHERLDGTGYPQGLKGDAIALEARILAVADVVEAMASHRPYRAGRGVESALQEISDKRARGFDPAVVDACVRLFRERRFSFDAGEEQPAAA